MHGVTAFLFVKGTAAGEAEGLVAEGQLAASLDTLERLRTVPEVDRVVVSTASAEFAAAARALGAQIEMDPAGKKFHWGHRLAELVSKHSASVPLYVGGGSGPLMSAADWRALVRRILGQRNSVVTNNLFSCDYAAWTPGKTIQDIDPPPLDNDLAFRLARRAGLRILALEKDAATQLDIDTPSDLVALSLHPGLGPHLREFLSRSDLDLSRARAVLSTLRDGDATGFIAGRVSASMMLLLEKETLCQWRVFSEERGMRASGRQERGQARSLVGLYLEIVGAKRFFDAVGQLANAAVIDSRVLFAHQGWRPSASDRFNSDLFRVEAIADPAVRDFTLAAREAKIPVLLGGHSLVSGGMYALVESTHPKNLLTDSAALVV